MYKNVLVTGGIVSSLLLTGASTTFAQNTSTEHNTMPKPMHRMMSVEHFADMATKLGLNADTVKQELSSGKTWQDILKENNITEAQLKTLFGTPKINDTHLLDLATKLGLNADQVKQELASGKKWQDILTEHNITKDQVKQLITSEKPNFGKRKGMMMLKMAPELLQAQANVLGMTTTDLQTALKNKQTLKSLVEAKGMTVEDFHQKVNEQIKAMIANGTITGKQADFYQKMLNHQPNMPAVNNNETENTSKS